MPNVTDALGLTFGPLTHNMDTETGSVGTTVTKVADPSTASDTHMRTVRICNTHATQSLAITVTDDGASTPTMTADGSSTDGVIILAQTSEVVNIRNDHELWIVGEAASTTYNLLIKWE